MNKLIIQIPSFNEEDALPVTLAALPREVPGFETVEWLVIDDGSKDRTIEVARAHGVDHVVKLTANRGLASAFQAGIDACLKLGADVIINTDADNQYSADDIPKLVAPIVEGRADMVVGNREITRIEHFSWSKKLLQRIGSSLIRTLSGTNVPDATSGFRAYNREAAIQTVVVSQFTYTLESLIAAGKMQIAVDHVAVATNPMLRESRLFPSVSSYVFRNGISIFRAYSMYHPLRVFSIAALVLGLGALGAWMPFLIDWLFSGDSSGHIQSLILGAVLSIAAVQTFALGIVGDILAGQRVITQRVYERVRRVELELGVRPSHYDSEAARREALTIE